MLNYQRVRLQAYVFNKKKSPSIFISSTPHMFTMETSNKSINFHGCFLQNSPGLVKAARHPWLFGASLTAMRNLGRDLGYTLVHLSDVDRRPGEISGLGMGGLGLLVKF